MKQKLYSILLTALFGLLGMNAWADTYEIATAQDLVDFAEAVNGGETTANAVLTAEIDLTDVTWTPIGNATTKYGGTFDGQGFAIKNFSYTATSDAGNGLFGYVNNATIKNFSISGELISDGFTYNGTIGAAEANTVISGIRSALNITLANKGAHSGGILGSTVTSGNPVLVENCEYSGTMTHTGAGDCQAGILGYTYNGGVKNCIFSGTIIGETNTKYGGILGYCKRIEFIGVQNCLSIGKIVAPSGCSTAAAIIANFNNDNTTQNVKNNYYCLKEGSTTTIAIGNKASSCEAPILVTPEQLASGEICYALNGNQAENVNWFQTLNSEAYPTPYGTDIVYPAGQMHCDGTAYEGITGFTNTPTTQDDHDFVDGFCTYCNALDVEYLTTNDDGFFELANKKQLIWFAAYVNQVNPAVNAILTANIDLQDVTWTPIGFGVNYTGTFDGQNHTISNFYLSTTANSSGLFGQISGNAVIKNFTIEGKIVSNGHQYVGGVVGNVPSGTVTISGVHSKVDISCTVSRHGGILGAQTNPSTINIDRCTYSGTFDAQNTSGNYGGFIGLTNNNTSAYVNITNSLFDGKIINVGDNAGGFVGYSRGCHLTIQNCLSNGSVSATNPGQFIGQLNATSNQTYAGENYYTLEEGKTQGTGSATEAGPAPLLATAAQLASGEVAYKLGEAWYQLIGTDETPVLDPTSPKVFEIAVTAAGYATFVPTENVLAIPEGVTAYVGQQDDTYVHLEEVTELPADNAFILKANEGAYYYNCTEEARTVTADNDLLFSTTDLVADGTQYVMAMVDGKTAFYQVNEGTTIAARKAYITCSSGVKAFFFGEDDATGISNVNTNANEKIYNLAGQRLSKTQKGINIVGNKKVLY